MVGGEDRGAFTEVKERGFVSSESPPFAGGKSQEGRNVGGKGSFTRKKERSFSRGGRIEKSFEPKKGRGGPLRSQKNAASLR